PQHVGPVLRDRPRPRGGGRPDQSRYAVIPSTGVRNATAAPEVRRSTRNGAVGLAGAAVNGAFGFVLTTVITRTFGAEGSGSLFTVIGLVTILGAVCCLGADTGLMWALPRRPAEARRLLTAALLPTLGL